MKDVRILQIDNRGRIVIPQLIRKSLGLTTNSQLMLVADSESKEIKITPIGLGDEKKIIKLRITMKDIPGALAKLASTFADSDLSMMYSEAVIIEKDRSAIWNVIVESPDFGLEKLKQNLFDKGALNVEILPLDK